MASKNPNEKGGEYERNISGRLSLWVSNFTRDDLFWRSAMSGGRATLKGRKKSAIKSSAEVGDISLRHKMGAPFLEIFTVECKHWDDLCLRQYLFGKKGHIADIWTKPLEEARAVRRQPMVCAKQSHAGELCFTTKKGYSIFNKGGDIEPIAIFPRINMYIFHMADVLVLDFSKMKKRRVRL